MSYHFLLRSLLLSYTSSFFSLLSLTATNLVQDLADGDVCHAKRALRSMHRLARGIDDDDDESAPCGLASDAADPMRVGVLGEYVIARKGKKLVLRMTEHKALVDVGK
jgi:hypothetical protein